MLFTALYRSWSHNAAATLALCFLAGAYEHASNLLSVLFVFVFWNVSWLLSPQLMPLLVPAAENWR